MRLSKTAPLLFPVVFMITLALRPINELVTIPTLTETLDSLVMTFPKDSTYAAHDLTYFQWESDLDTTFHYRLTVYEDAQRETITLDSIYNPFKLTTSYSGRDTLLQIIPGENRIDLNHLFTRDQNYYWTLLAYDEQDTTDIEGSFEVEQPGFSLTVDTTAYINFDYVGNGLAQDIFFFQVDQPGTIRDLNVRFLYDSRDNSISGDDASPEIILTHPDGTEIVLSHIEDWSKLKHQKVFDDEAFLSIEEFYEGRDFTLAIDIPEDGTGLMDYRARPTDSLRAFTGKNITGEWTLRIIFDDDLYFYIDPSSAELEFVANPLPIEAEVIDWSNDQVTLQWETQDGISVSGLEKKIAPDSVFQEVAGFDSSSDTFIDTFQNPGEEITYRVVGQSNDQEEVYSNELLVNSPLIPFVHDSTSIGVAVESGSDHYDFIGWTINWLQQPVNAKGFFITEDTTVTPAFNLTLPEVVNQPDEGVVYFRAYHEYDTTDWYPVAMAFELISPIGEFEVGELSSDSLTFEWSSNLEGSADLVIRRREGNIGFPVIEAKTINMSQGSFTLYAEDLDWVTAPDTYSWSISSSDFNLPFDYATASVVLNSPPELAIASWDKEGVTLSWESDESFTDLRLEKRLIASDTYEQVTELAASTGTYFDSFTATNQAYAYRITGTNALDASVSTNDLVVKSALDPVEYSSISIDQGGYGCGDIAVYKINWIQHPTASGYLISSTYVPGVNETYSPALPDDFQCLLMAVRAIHEFDTSEVTVVKIDLELTYPNKVVSQSELDSTLFTFRFESNIDNNLIAKVYRFEENNWKRLFDPKLSNSGKVSIWGEDLELLRQPGRYRWSVGVPLEEFGSREFTVDAVLSTVRENSLIEIWPNPADQMLNIKSPQRIDRWEILDLSGRVMLEGLGHESRVEINLSELPAGVYLLKTESKGQQAHHRLIKQ